MSDEELDVLLRRALLDALKEEWEEPLEQLPSFETSTRHQRDMRNMLSNPLKWMKRQTETFWKSSLRRVAIFLLILSLSFSCLMAASSSVRAAVLLWTEEWNESYIAHIFLGEGAYKKIPDYGISNLPDGYMETERTKLYRIGEIVTYQNDTGEKIRFTYFVMQSGMVDAVNLDENDEVSRIYVNGMEGEYYHSSAGDSRNMIIWRDTSVNLVLKITAFMDYDEIMCMAESVSCIK